MTTQEFSDSFDVLLNSYRDIKQFGETDSLVSLELDEYEKSVFLTLAQEELVENIYNGNGSMLGFEKTEEARRNLSNLVVTTTLPLTPSGAGGIWATSQVATLPDNLLYLVYETTTLNYVKPNCGTDQCIAHVKPVSHDDLYRIMRNPFKKESTDRTLRLDIVGTQVELIAEFPILSYKIRYVREPQPIILADLTSSGLNINGVSTVSECELFDFLHKFILNLAVQKAYSTRMSQNAGQLDLMKQQAKQEKQ